MRKTILICVLATITSIIILCIYGGIGTSLGIVLLKRMQHDNNTVVDSKTVTDDKSNIDFPETTNSLIEVTEIEKNDYIRTQLHEAQYYRYYNSRFEFNITYPSCFIQQEESTNGDGCRFYMNDKIYLSVSASYNPLNETITDRFHEYDLSSVTYSKLKNNWFVVSDYTSDGRIFYQKTALRDDVFITAILCYPPEYKNDFQGIIQKIFSKFPN